MSGITQEIPIIHLLGQVGVLAFLFPKEMVIRAGQKSRMGRGRAAGVNSRETKLSSSVTLQSPPRVLECSVSILFQ